MITAQLQQFKPTWRSRVALALGLLTGLLESLALMRARWRSGH